MMAQRRVTDRAERYRANKLLPVKGKSCLLCGSTRNLVPDHWDGHPDHTNPGNLEVLCKSCNTAKGAAFAKAGRGRLTHQYNPTKGGGAANVGEWVNAVGAITPHVDRGDRGLTTTMTTRDGVDMIRATPQSKRRDFAAKLRKRSNPWLFSRSAPAPVARRGRTGGLSLTEASSAALRAGRTSGDLSDFDSWLERKHLDTRSDGVISRIRESYARGVDKADADEQNAQFLKDKREQAREAARDRAEQARDERAAAGRGRKSKAAGASPYASMPDEATLEAGFKRGLSLADMLRSNPSLRKGAALYRGAPTAELGKGNYPGTFLSLRRDATADVAKEYGDVEPHAYVTTRSLKLFDAAKARAKDSIVLKFLKEHPEEQEYVGDGQDRRGYFAGLFEQPGDSIVQFLESKGFGGMRWGHEVFIFDNSALENRRNPAAAAAEVYEEFHGFPPDELVTVSRKRHYHKHVAAAGDLVGLQVKPINKGHVRTIEGLGECFLAFNEAKNQLFIEGGDQRMSPAELKKFGVTDEHELQTLGKLVGVGYFTNKEHLGKEGGEAVYSHTFRGINENGKHVIVKIARDPDLIYRVLDEQFEVSGGSYEILREGINK